jgi:hypothetical protein
MLRNNFEVRWTEDSKNSFNAIKEAIVTTPILISPDFNKEFKSFHLHQKIQLQLYYCREMLMIRSIQSPSSVKS